MFIEFTVGSVEYEFSECDMDSDAEFSGWGYDIYVKGDPHCINLGDVAYFDTEPTQKDAEKWLEDFGYPSNDPVFSQPKEK